MSRSPRRSTNLQHLNATGKWRVDKNSKLDSDSESPRDYMDWLNAQLQAMDADMLITDIQIYCYKPEE
jgi:hypothetical protein